MHRKKYAPELKKTYTYEHSFVIITTAVADASYFARSMCELLILNFLFSSSVSGGSKRYYYHYHYNCHSPPHTHTKRSAMTWTCMTHFSSRMFWLESGKCMNWIEEGPERNTIKKEAPVLSKNIFFAFLCKEYSKAWRCVFFFPFLLHFFFHPFVPRRKRLNWRCKCIKNRNATAWMHVN